jgi:predicted  nucleic acid-binding Zn-ribbon protein
LEPVFPQLVGEQELQGQDRPYKTVAYTEFATIACKAVQELKVRTDEQAVAISTDVADLQAEVADKDARIDALEARLAALEKLISEAK